MARRLLGITLDSLAELPEPCRTCVFWEGGPAGSLPTAVTGSAAAERHDPEPDCSAGKEAWLSGVLLDWGGCGSILTVDGVVAGFVLYAPAGYVPRAAAFGSSPVSADAVLLMTARVVPEFADGGLGRVLVQAAAKELIRRGFRAIEAFGRAGGGDPVAGEPGHGGQPCCVLPVGFLRAVGFKTVRPHPVNPRMRLELRSVATWRTDVESALERILGTVGPDRAARPV